MAYAEVGGVRIYYETAGEGPPLLLVSGTGWSGEHWKLAQVPYFSATHRVVVFDHRGTGRSDRPAAGFSTRQFAADAVEVLAAAGIGEPAHVLGHSMGGRVAQWIALDHPASVRSLVLASSGPGPIEGRPHFSGISPELAAEFVRLGWPGYNEAHLRGPNMFAIADAATVEAFAATHRGRFGTDLLSYLRHVDARQRHETTGRLGEIAAPTLVIVGSEDTYGAPSHVETSRYLAEAIAGARYVVLDGAAHALHVETAEAFNEAVAGFLRAN